MCVGGGGALAAARADAAMAGLLVVEEKGEAARSGGLGRWQRRRGTARARAGLTRRSEGCVACIRMRDRARSLLSVADTPQAAAGVSWCVVYLQEPFLPAPTYDTIPQAWGRAAALNSEHGLDKERSRDPQRSERSTFLSSSSSVPGPYNDSEASTRVLGETQDAQ